jgi:putative transposase
MLDKGSSWLLGFALREHHDAQQAYGALAMAVTVRGSAVPGVILHTDRAANTPRGPMFSDLEAECIPGPPI